MNETNTALSIIVGFFLGFMFALGLVCLYQFMNDQYGSSPLKEVMAFFL